MHEVRYSCSTISRIHILKPKPSGNWWNTATQHPQRRKKIKECVFSRENHTTVLWHEMLFLWLSCIGGQEWTMTATLKHYARSSCLPSSSSSHRKMSERFLQRNNTGHTSMRTYEAITKFGRRVLPHVLYSGNITLSPRRSFGNQPPRVPLRGWCGTAECRVPVSAPEGGQLTDREYMFFFKCERRLLTNMATILQITCLQQWYASFVKLLYAWNGNNINRLAP